MGKTEISWCDYSWPVVNGCRRISDGCQSCYAERLIATRLKHLPKYQGLSEMTPAGPRWTGETRLWEPDLTMPLRIKRPSKIFVANMGDLFFEQVPLATIARVFEVITDPKGRHHTYQILTKRAERMYRVLTDELPNYILEHYPQESPLYASLTGWPPRQLWVGVSAEDQARWDARQEWLFRLKDAGVAVTFASFEPLLSPMDVTNGYAWVRGILREDYQPPLTWAIIGGESGPGYRPMQVGWVREIVQQCRPFGVKIWVKQDSGMRPGQQGRIPDALFLQEMPV